MKNPTAKAPHIAIFGSLSYAWESLIVPANNGHVGGHACIRGGPIWNMRAIVAEMAWKAGFDVQIQIDSDLSFTPETIRLLTEACLETRGVVGTIVARSKRNGGLATAPPPRQVEPYRSDEVYLVDIEPHQGIGAPMAIYREAYWSAAELDGSVVQPIEGVPECESVFWPLRGVKDADGGPAPSRLDDAAFCDRVREAGHRCSVLMHPEIVITHWGMHGFTVEGAMMDRRIAAALSEAGRAC